ncbi:uncharacterized protein TEOVI_000738900 [Trypanosoma equiperdum]|uniref:Uncharacterized protein n=4 Tax=Trypanozoon TaxID=39700 RepID=Q38BE6_TRYB2|nr:hypothetical protein, conserved [Trypanosoma brucei gambiense DAL972]XP_822702.1 hypothetical protein, conserved [Trypanosoma brucei brucei TREU927]RHW69232.1 hypothetical protein DPX39_100051000 [Trypanosoma brucei equiperdum]SCU67403.1 hypothetical protein, conserved [Trypanosoma equiperdum]EAN77874.1 hypothetical protein, conserved [Trypanosoma brucei brucei TREU927]CBH15473.1 hypothetical protein, conserved [Trypanosoma brucei gambiense DAL972]|eukprot:XP_011777737.1 hypothetical protein, conserved [Trypanosoma brucei gambiense DAL972]
MGSTPHYSRVVDAPEALNVVTGRSIYYGMRPWRCDDRFQDFMGSFLRLDSPVNQFQLAKLLWRCARSKSGEEPLDDYRWLGRKEVMFYVERYGSGMMRTGIFERYPYNQNELQRVMEEDGLRMRVWRHQRELEMESKQGKVDDLLRTNVMNTVKKP